MPDLDFILQNIPAVSGNTDQTPDTPLDHVTVKIAVIGASQAGKSALCETYVDDPPTAYKMTAGMELKRKITPISGKMVHLFLMDFSGRPQYHALLRPLIATADGYLFVFDVTRKETLEYLRKQMTELVSMNPQFAAVVVGNRSDLEERRQVSREEGEEFAALFRLPYMETSVKNRSSVTQCFVAIGKICMDRITVPESGRRRSVQGADVKVDRQTPLVAPPRVKKLNENSSSPVSSSTVPDRKVSPVITAQDDDEF